VHILRLVIILVLVLGIPGCNQPDKWARSLRCAHGQRVGPASRHTSMEAAFGGSPTEGLVAHRGIHRRKN